ncbi:MAG: hypothetical protein QM784_26420 [Polyangiaceae bacterium]
MLIDGNPERIIEQIKLAKLRGRGGAGYQTGLKWEVLRNARAEKKFIVCNADEGDPGAYMNRNEIESDPHSLIEGMLIGGYVMGASEGIIYVRAEYPLAVYRLTTALAQARAYGLLGSNILGRGFSFDSESRRGGRCFRVRRRNGVDLLSRGKSRAPTTAAAVSRTEGTLRFPDEHQQRRNLVQRCAHRHAWSCMVFGNGIPEESWDQGIFSGGKGQTDRSRRNASWNAAQGLRV